MTSSLTPDLASILMSGRPIGWARYWGGGGGDGRRRGVSQPIPVNTNAAAITNRVSFFITQLSSFRTTNDYEFLSSVPTIDLLGMKSNNITPITPSPNFYKK
jgi:hypothetical protein